MSNEITITAGLAALKNGLAISESTVSLLRDWAGSHRQASVQDIGTTLEALAVPVDLATFGLCFLQNLDLTNYVEVGIDDASALAPLIKLYPGDIAIVRFANVSIYAKAHSSTVKLNFILLEA